MAATPKDEEIKIRVPTAMKKAVQALAESRFTSESAIAREALGQYLQRHGIEIPTGKPSSARRRSKTDSSSPIVDIVRKHHPAGSKPGVPPKGQK